MSQPENNVLRYDHATWKTMLMVKGSINWYKEKLRFNDKYGTARRKEEKILKSLMEEGFAA